MDYLDIVEDSIPRNDLISGVVRILDTTPRIFIAGPLIIYSGQVSFWLICIERLHLAMFSTQNIVAKTFF